MLLITLIVVPLIGIFLILTTTTSLEETNDITRNETLKTSLFLGQNRAKVIALVTSLINL